MKSGILPRLLAVIAAPLCLYAQPALCRPAPVADVVSATLPHISITAIGSGPPVVLIPGLASPRAVWDGIAPTLARTHRVILVQVNGFAGDAPGANVGPGVLDGVVADLHGWLAAQNLARPAVIGHSLGGLVGLMLARAHPEDVGRLMLVDTLPWYGMVFGPGATVDAVAPRAVAMRDAMAASYGKPADPALAAATAARLALMPGARATVAGYAARSDSRVTGEAMYEDFITDLRPAMTTITTPITLIYPTSAAMPREQADAFYRSAYASAPHVTYVPVADSGHFVMLDQPAAFAAAVDGFVR